jgi:hypothetical protein
LPLMARSGTVSTPELAQVVRLSLSDQVKHIVSKDIVTESADQMQAQELSRIVQQAAAYRLAQDLKRRAEAAQQAQVNRQQLVKVFHQARQTVVRQRFRLDQIEKLPSPTAAHWQGENRRLENNITLLRRRIEELRLANQQLEEERKQLALKE